MSHAMDGEVMLAYQMNGAEIPLLNGYPVNLIVPGYYGTYTDFKKSSEPVTS